MTRQNIRGARTLEASLRDLFAGRVRDHKAPGSYFAVFDADGIVFEGGFGQRRHGGPAPDGRTRFRIASCTKSFTSAALLVLRDRGELQLDCPVTDFVPALRAAQAPGRPAWPTIRMLMSMSGGLPTDDPWADRQESLSTAGLVEVLQRGVRFATVPGTAFEYSNLGYALLGQVIEAVTGRPYAEVVTTQLLEPLGLSSIVFDRELVPADAVAIGHRRRGDEWVDLPFSGPGAFSSIGGAFAAPQDLARWAQWLGLAHDPLADEAGPLSAASRREMQQIHRAILPEPAGTGAGSVVRGYGYGLFVEEDRVWGRTVHHSGGYPGFGAHMRWNAPSGIGVVAFENATYADVWQPVAEALRLTLEHLGQPDLLPAVHAEALALRPRIESLIHGWDDDIADGVFAENVALDVPYEERAAAIAEAVALVGPLAAPVTEADVPECSANSSGHMVWHLPGRRGRLRCEILLSPTTPAKVQTFVVAAEPAAGEGGDPLP